MTTTLNAWLATLPPSGFKGTSTALRSDLARCLAPGESLPPSRMVARTVAGLLAETKYTLRRRRLTKARLIIVEPAATAEAVAAIRPGAGWITSAFRLPVVSLASCGLSRG